VLDIQIGGINGVEDIFIREDKGNWVVDTQGSNLSSIFYYDWLELSKCTSSDIWEIRKILGVEATRQFIINEFYKVLSVSGASVGRRHIELLADSMTFQGKINSVNRYGIDRNETGPLAKASFEESVNNFFIAATNGETDDMGVSSSVMAGKLAQFGSGYFDVLFDISRPLHVPHLPDPLGDIMKEQLFVRKEQKEIHIPIKPYVAPIYQPKLEVKYEPKMLPIRERPNPVPYQIPETLKKDEPEEKKVVSWVKRKKPIQVQFSKDE
jgi:hypothetical protein